MKESYYLFFIFIFFLFYSCEKCPKGIKRADIKLSSRSLEYLPGNISNTVIFKNANNDLVTFTFSGLKNTIDQLVTDVPCSHPPLSATYNYVNTEIKEINYDNDSISLSYRLSIFNGFEIENPVRIDTNFVDAINLGIFNKLNNSDLLGLTLITDMRGKTLTNDSNNSYVNSYVYHNSYTLIDTTFTSVYSDNNNNFFYNKELGIIGFTTNGVLYRYKNSN